MPRHRTLPLTALLAAALVGVACAGLRSPGMDQQRLEALVREKASDVSGRPGALEFSFGGVRMACVSDPAHDRMRLIAPIVQESAMTPEQRRSVMIANFHTALDARYAVSDGVLFAAFIHPLSPLDEAQLESALAQVANLARTFGSTYSSGGLTYGGGRAEEAERETEL